MIYPLCLLCKGSLSIYEQDPESIIEGSAGYKIQSPHSEQEDSVSLICGFCHGIRGFRLQTH